MTRLAPLRCSSYLRLFALDKNRKFGTVISNTEETIKPSSPTPRHLTKFKLSLIDNHTPPLYVPFVFFYPAPVRIGSEPSSFIDTLKSSLALALTRFYPLAGRLSEFFFCETTSSSSSSSSIPIIDCNDRGVPFSVATFDDGGAASMALFLRTPKIESLQQLLPFPAKLRADIESAPQIALRATVFPCGGVAVGFCLFHKIIDGHTIFSFLKLWAAIARGNEPGGAYAHDRAATSLFPAHPDDVVPSANYLSEGGEKTVTRRFVFDGEAISRLKNRCMSERVPNPSRSLVVSALLWKSVVNATATTLSPNVSIHSLGAMAMNLRPRMKEQWADYSVGNMLWGASSFYNNRQQPYSSDETMGLQQLVYQLRSSIAKVDSKFMEKLEGGAGRDEFLRNKEMKSKVLMEGANQGSKVMAFTVSSVAGTGLYDVDFGWGKPVWVSMAKFADRVSNTAVMMDSPVEQGIETWVALHEQEMTILRHDVEFLTYAKDNPNLLETVSARE